MDQIHVSVEASALSGVESLQDSRPRLWRHWHSAVGAGCHIGYVRVRDITVWRHRRDLQCRVGGELSDQLGEVARDARAPVAKEGLSVDEDLHRVITRLRWPVIERARPRPCGPETGARG